MARIPLLESTDLPTDSRPIYERIASTRGSLPNVFKALAHSPGALDKVAAVGEFIRYGSSLPAELRELAILLVAKERRCDYEWAQHWAVAQRIEMSRELLDRIGRPELEAEADPIGAVAEYTRRMLNREEIGDPLLERLREHLGEVGLVDLTVLVGYYELLAGFIGVFDVELEEGVPRPPVTTAGS